MRSLQPSTAGCGRSSTCCCTCALMSSTPGAASPDIRPIPNSRAHGATAGACSRLLALQSGTLAFAWAPSCGRHIRRSKPAAQEANTAARAGTSGARTGMAFDWDHASVRTVLKSLLTRANFIFAGCRQPLSTWAILMACRLSSGRSSIHIKLFSSQQALAVDFLAFSKIQYQNCVKSFHTKMFPAWNFT